MEKRIISTPRPQTWLYVPVQWVCRVLSRLLFGLRITGREALPKDGPLLVLASHQGMMDFMLAFAALRGRRAQFVATQRQFRNPRLHWLYKRLGVIPKVQFHTDPRCVMNILRVLRGGGTVVIFPAGQTSVWGIPGAIAPSMAHLVKKAGVPVCTLGLRGGFFTAPRFGGLRFGRMEARLTLAFSPEQLTQLDEDAIYHRLCQLLDYNEYDWQQQTGVRFRGRQLAQGYDQILFRCPRCGAEGAWKSEGDAIRCTCCGNRGLVGHDLQMRPADPESVVFPTLVQWYRWQEGLLAERLAEPEFSLRGEAVCQLFDEEAFAWREAGRGQLSLDRRAIGYQGEIDGQPVQLTVEHAHLPGLSAKPGHYVELWHEGYGLVRYCLTEPSLVIRLKLVQEYLYRTQTAR